jgi:hypothetical protein
MFPPPIPNLKLLTVFAVIFCVKIVSPVTVPPLNGKKLPPPPIPVRLLPSP